MNRLFFLILALSLFSASLFAQKPADTEWMKQYQLVKVPVNGYHVVANAKGKFGLADVSGKQIIPCMYKEVGNL
jgi:hypothetical protein